MEGITARLEASLGARIDTIKHEVAQQVGASRDMDQAVQARFDIVEARAGQDRTRISVLERHAQNAAKRLQKLEREMAIAETMDVEVEALDVAWTRPPCRQLLRVNTESMVSEAAVAAAVEQ